MRECINIIFIKIMPLLLDFFNFQNAVKILKKKLNYKSGGFYPPPCQACQMAAKLVPCGGFYPDP